MMVLIDLRHRGDGDEGFCVEICVAWDCSDTILSVGIELLDEFEVVGNFAMFDFYCDGKVGSTRTGCTKW